MRLSDSCRLLAFTAFAAAAGGPGGIAAKFTDQEHTQIEEPRPADLPSDKELREPPELRHRQSRHRYPQYLRPERSPRSQRFVSPREPSAHSHQTLHGQGSAAVRQRRQIPRPQTGGNRTRPAPVDLCVRCPGRARALCRRQSRRQGHHQGCLDLGVLASPSAAAGGHWATCTNFNLQDSNFLGWGKTLQVSHGSTVDRTQRHRSPGRTRMCSDPDGPSQLTYSDSSDADRTARCR